MFNKKTRPGSNPEATFHTSGRQSPRMSSRPIEGMGTNRPETTLVFGVHAILEALAAGKQLETVYLKKGLDPESTRELIRELRTAKTPYHTVPIEKINRMAPGKNHQGIVGVLAEVTYVPIDEVLQQVLERGEVPLLGLIDGVTDVRNIGAIARSAACFNLHALVVASSGRAQLNGDAIKTSAGGLHHIPVARAFNLSGLIRRLKKEYGIRFIALAERGEQSIHELDLTGPVGLVLGDEETGVSGEVLEECLAVAKVPVKGAIRSLNVSVAAGVVFYEAVMQRLYQAD